MDITLSLFAALFLVVLNGFFVAAEFAFVKLRATRVAAISRQHGWRGRIVRMVHGHLDTYLSACQLGITLASLGLGWIGEPAFAHLLQPLFHAFAIAPRVADGIALACAFFVISFLHIVAGELAPKSLAIRKPEATGIATAAPLYLFYWVMYPAIWLLNGSANRMLAVFGLDPAHSTDAPYGEDEIKVILRSSRPPRHFTRDEWNTVAHSLEFGGLTVSDLMRPLREAVGFRVGDNFDADMEVAQLRRYSRYPLFDEDGDTVLGMIDLKDVLFRRLSGDMSHDLQRLARPVLHVLPETPALELLRRFRAGAPHFAVVGRPALKPVGFATLSDLISALVGQIRDDVRATEIEWQQMPDGSVVGRGSLSIVSLEHVLGVNFGTQNSESVGGMILDRLGELPKEGQTIEFEPAAITVKQLAGPRIAVVAATPRPDQAR
jgi:CBS domain containing-hemolysin-like protein